MSNNQNYGKEGADKMDRSNTAVNQGRDSLSKTPTEIDQAGKNPNQGRMGETTPKNSEKL